MKTSLLLLVVILAAPARVPAPPKQQQPTPQAGQQPTAAGVEHFSKEGLSFDYPAGWKLTDNGNAQVQSFMLTRPGASTVVLVFAHREPVMTAEQLYAARINVTIPYVESVARKLGIDKGPPPSEAQCINVGESSAVGFRLAGRVGTEPTTAEVYTVVLGQRLLHLAHIRNDKDEAQGAPAWKALLDTLKVEPPATPSPEAEMIKDIAVGGVLNGKALKKPQPEYPAGAKMARAQGTVVVQIVVDEKGDVVSAQAISGHPQLRKAGEDAARRAKFSPTTLCGQPVKVSGVITYNFVLM